MSKFRHIITRALHLRNFHKISVLQNENLIDPPYLEAMKSKVPLYDTLNIQLRSYDFPVVESYQKFVHTMLKNMDVDVEDGWAAPHQELQITNLKSRSEIVQAQYNLKLYERTLQITDVMSTQLPLILRALEASTPAGVTVQIVPHDISYEEVRYVPDTDLLNLKQELEDMGGPSKASKKK